MEIFLEHLANSAAILKDFRDPGSRRLRLFPCLKIVASGCGGVGLLDGKCGLVLVVFMVGD